MTVRGTIYDADWWALSEDESRAFFDFAACPQGNPERAKKRLQRRMVSLGFEPNLIPLSAG
jgi:hypothetical protein